MADGINTELVAIDFLAEIQADRKQQEAQWALESKRTEDFWNGLTAPDAAAERFDTGPGAVVLSVKRSRWECDDWLKVHRIHYNCFSFFFFFYGPHHSTGLQCNHTDANRTENREFRVSYR
jgi:hypothetical protein